MKEVNFMFCDERYSTKELETHIRMIYAKLQALAKQDGVYKQMDDYFGVGTPKGEDGSFCYSDVDGYHFGVYERGVQRLIIVTQSLLEITYQVLASDLFWMAVDYERAHRVEGQDIRRLIFSKEIEYWSVLGVDLAARAVQKIKESLEKAPFID